MTVALTIEDVHVELGRNQVLRGVSLDVRAGEFVTLLGPSGSGKSTTLNVVAGLERVSAGHVLFDGAEVASVPPQDRGIGVVFQSYALFPHMTVGENIAFPLLTRHRPKAERRETVRKMLELVQLPDLESRKVAALSGGQQQRVALARALAADPRLLLLDEPMAALDKQLRESMQTEIRRLQRQVGITTIAVTHDQTEALTMSDRVAVMRDGRIDQYDAPEALYRAPASTFVARFLGDANLIPVQQGRLDGFGTAAGRPAGTAVLRPEDLTLLDADESGGCVEGRLTLKSFQGTRIRLEAQHPALGTLIAHVPPHTDVSALAEGSPVRLGCRDPKAVHVIPPETDAPAGAAVLEPA
ncbi:ABC transporter ATP-binding protein [Streptomyces sp. NPDC059373]